MQGPRTLHRRAPRTVRRFNYLHTRRCRTDRYLTLIYEQKAGVTINEFKRIRDLWWFEKRDRSDCE